jgi:DNA-binding NtrC family response regulator
VAAAEAASGTPARSFFDLRSEYVSRFEREYFTSLLKRHTGNVKESAIEARLPRGTLYRLLSAHSIDPGTFRGRG